MPIFGFGGPLSAMPGPRPDRCGCRIFGLPGRPATATGVMPWARSFAFLSRRPIWRLAHKKMLRTGWGSRGPGAQQNSLRTNSLLFYLQVVRLKPTSAPCQSESSTAVLLGALQMKFRCEFEVLYLSGLPAAAAEMLPWARDLDVKTSSQFFWVLCGF
jgi:hypothetical protein